MKTRLWQATVSAVERLIKVWALACLYLSLALSTPAQRPMRFSLQTDLLDLTNCLAQPGSVPIPLGSTNANIEIINWTTKPVRTNGAGEFIIRFKRPTTVGTLIQYEGGQVSVEISNEWVNVPAPLDAGRKL
ncbi:MAG TPA: hypothetical protein VK615_13335 [Candidatus Binatia bacterium]|nr:hypothetical protein [Candidatus Binatia bacterium]